MLFVRVLVITISPPPESLPINKDNTEQSRMQHGENQIQSALEPLDPDVMDSPLTLPAV